MCKKELIKRYCLFVLCLFFMGMGVALTKHGELGVSPISSVANVVSCKFTALSFGNWLIISNCVLLVGQILLLRKKFQPIQLLQIPLSVLFGYFTDFGMYLVKVIPNEAYVMRLALVFGGIIVLGFGITLGVIADVILNSGEAFVKALADVAKKDFGSMKIIFDVCWVLLSVVLSLIFFNGQLVGTREGTLISALCVGLVVKFFRPLLQKPLKGILQVKKWKIGKVEYPHMCPVCKKYNFVELFEDCPVCNWCNDVVQEEHPDWERCANNMSLTMAQEAYSNGEKVQ